MQGPGDVGAHDQARVVTALGLDDLDHQEDDCDSEESRDDGQNDHKDGLVAAGFSSA